MLQQNRTGQLRGGLYDVMAGNHSAMPAKWDFPKETVQEFWRAFGKGSAAPEGQASGERWLPRTDNIADIRNAFSKSAPLAPSPDQRWFPRMETIQDIQAAMRNYASRNLAQQPISEPSVNRPINNNYNAGFDYSQLDNSIYNTVMRQGLGGLAPMGGLLALIMQNQGTY